MTKFVVKATWNGTSKFLAVSANHPIHAFGKALASKDAKGAAVFIVYERKTMCPVFTGLNHHAN